MQTPLEQALTKSYKTDMIAYINTHPNEFEELITLALSHQQPYSWRAAWLLWSCLEYNDKRLHGKLENIVDLLPKTNDNQLRELLIILQKMELNESYEGKLFDYCLNIWEKVGKQASIRVNAFKVMVKIIKKHPELRNELMFLTEPYYMDSLSVGVRKSIKKLMKEII